MKSNWEYKKLGEVCASKRLIKRAAKEYSPNDEIAYIDISSIDNDTQSMTSCTTYIMSDAPSRAQQCVQEGDIVVSTVRPNLKNIAIVDTNERNLVASSGFCVLRPTDIERNYLFHYIISDKFTNHLMSLTTGANYPAVRDSDILDSLIPLPPLEVQQSIVSELDLINELIAKKKAQLKDLDSLAQSLFYEMFGDPVENEKGWPVLSLGEISNKIANGYNAKLEPDTYKSEGVMYFRCQNVWKNRFDYSDLVYIDEETNKKMKSSSLKYKDLLITKIGRVYTENSSLGRVSMYEGENDKANLSGNLCFIRLNGANNHRFVLYILISNQFRDYIRRTTVGGIDKRALNTKQISSFPIIIPPIEMQNEFEQHVLKIEAQKQKIQNSIQILETLLASRMQYWFE